MAASDETSVALTSKVVSATLHYELEQISKIDIMRKLKKRFGAKNYSRRPLSRRLTEFRPSRGIAGLACSRHPIRDFGEPFGRELLDLRTQFGVRDLICQRM
jgi:hypothetical protein